MQKYFISRECFERRVLEGDTAFQIKTVLRGKIKDQFLLGVDAQSYLVEITKMTSKEVFFEVIEEQTKNVELPFVVDLYQGFPKGDKLEQIIKYGTQLGMGAIYPVIMKRSVVKIENSKKEVKQKRYQKIAVEAAEQSLRNQVPFVAMITELDKIDFSSYDVKLLCYEESAKNQETSEFKKQICSLKPGNRVAVVVGPEGGIDPKEKSFLEQQGFVCVGLGPRILRTETVVLYVLSAISYEWELGK